MRQEELWGNLRWKPESRRWEVARNEVSVMGEKKKGKLALGPETLFKACGFILRTEGSIVLQIYILGS